MAHIHFRSRGHGRPTEGSWSDYSLMAPIQSFGRFFRCERPGTSEGGESPVGRSQDPEMAPSVDRESDFGRKFDFLVCRRYDRDVEGSLKGKSDASVGNLTNPHEFLRKTIDFQGFQEKSDPVLATDQVPLLHVPMRVSTRIWAVIMHALTLFRDCFSDASLWCPKA